MQCELILNCSNLTRSYDDLHVGKKITTINLLPAKFNFLIKKKGIGLFGINYPTFFLKVDKLLVDITFDVINRHANRENTVFRQQ